MPTPTRVHIGNVIRNAVIFNVRSWSGEPMDPESLLQTVRRLFALLQERQVRYVLAGGIALLHYVEGRNTEDIDLIMASPALAELPEIQVISRDRDFARGTFEGLQVDILLAENPLFEKVRRRYSQVQSFLETDVPTATVEGLVLLKLYALPSLYRQGDFARVAIYESDLAMLMHQYRPAMDRLFEELADHLIESDTASLREIVAEIEQRIARFRRSAGEDR